MQSCHVLTLVACDADGFQFLRNTFYLLGSPYILYLRFDKWSVRKISLTSNDIILSRSVILMRLYDHAIIFSSILWIIINTYIMLLENYVDDIEVLGRGIHVFGGKEGF